MELNPLFLVAGANGSGKTLVLKALSQYLGMMYCRVDCVSVGGAVPGQAEGKIKAIFSQLKTLAPCILHLSNFEVPNLFPTFLYLFYLRYISLIKYYN